MKTEKMSLATIQGKLSRAEMKEVMAGYMEKGTCYLRCDQNSTNGESVPDCNRSTITSGCSDTSNAVCVCA